MSTPIPAKEPAAPAEADAESLEARVHAALLALPSQFESSLHISGIKATDLFAFNSAFGANVEDQVVEGLNRLRASIWDPDEEYGEYLFERQPQTFPDVVLRAQTPGKQPEILMGLELKGWYALAKEREPSGRYRVTPAVCAPRDLLVIFPWALEQVVSGSPKLYTPFVISARYAAQLRNWHWVHQRQTGDPPGITVSTVTDHYPNKGQHISDVPDYDNGGNFGRFARTGFMDEYIPRLFASELVGIPLDHWQRFFSLFKEASTGEKISLALIRWQERLTKQQRTKFDAQLKGMQAHVQALGELLGELPD